MWRRRYCPLLSSLSLAFGLWGMAEHARGEPVRPYDGFQASAEAHDYWEGRRIDALNRQIGWNELFRWRAAAAASDTLFYEPYVPGGFGYFDPYAGGLPWGGADYWPYARGRIFGYGYFNPVPQPIGRREIQTGPNRWESFPIYAEDLAKPAPLAVAPPGPPVAAPPPAPSPPKSPEPPPRGREF